MNAVSSGQGRYCDMDGNQINVSVNSQGEVLPPMSVFQYVAAFTDPLNVRRFVLGARLVGYEFLAQVDHPQMPTVCSGKHRCWIYFGGRGSAWLWTYDHETDMLFICVIEEANYELRLIQMLLRLRRSILAGSNSQDLRLSHVGLCFLDCAFPPRRSQHRMAIFGSPWTSCTDIENGHLLCPFSFHTTVLRLVYPKSKLRTALRFY